jgi:hypothetical protein
VAEATKTSYQPGRDTRPLLPDELSPTQVNMIGEIEERISEIRNVAKHTQGGKVVGPWARAIDRHRQVLLLDGDRGTGKTSVLVTLVRRWNPPDSEEYDARLGKRPDFIKVLPILDFDPLPPGLPLAAWIIQAWRPPVAYFDSLVEVPPDDRSDEDTLLDRWKRLFNVAATGWSEIPQSAGLIGQVIDRQDQLRDLQHLSTEWHDFVEALMAAGNRLPKSAKALAKNPVFVIMIDDVDLQVRRVRELLPALRLLHHPSVVFMVAADREHLVDMLALDFLGQQRESASVTGNPSNDFWDNADTDRWSSTLATAAFEKVFSTRDHWKMKRLSLSDLLEFPRGSPSQFKDVLNARGPVKETTSRLPEALRETDRLGDYILKFAASREKYSPGSTAVMTYRTAQQLADDVFTVSQPWSPGHATDLLRRLLDPGDQELAVAIDLSEPATIDFRVVGEVSALFSPELIDVIYPRLHVIVLGGRPKFVLRGDDGANNEENATVALLAISLQDSAYGVTAPGLQWEARLALAWTRWFMNDVGIEAAFRWPLHVLPSPSKLAEWAAEWNSFIRVLAREKSLLRDRMAYGWIYHQLGWLKASLDGVAAPNDANVDDPEVWDGLMRCEPPVDIDPSLGEARWRRRTLPLLARPEIGFTPRVQQVLWERSAKESAQELKAERRRLVRDAFDAVAAERGGVPRGGAEEEGLVASVLAAIDRQYPDAPWTTFMNSLPEE